MDVTVIVEHDTLGDGKSAWWTHSEEVPGFSAADNRLQVALDRSEEVIRETVPTVGKISFRLAGIDAIGWTTNPTENDQAAQPDSVGPAKADTLIPA